MIVIKTELQAYLDGNADLIPLHTWNKQTNKKGKIQVRGKTPLYGDWTTRPKDVKDTIEQAKKGYNIGYRLADTDLIVDVDPRNFKNGEDSLKLLFEWLEVEDLADYYPTVNTGGGGFHYYMTKPANVNIKGELERFPGIEFKSMGRQVVAAGSRHPNGKFYTWDDFCEYTYSERKEAPAKLLKALKRDEITNQAESGTLTPKQLEKLLDQLDISNFDTNDTWFPIMCASHHGTNGTGIEEFVEWSTGDPKYSNDDQFIRTRWDSLGGKKLNFTVNTLYKTVLSYGGTTSITSASEEFEDFTGTDSLDELEDEDFDLSDVIGTKQTKSSMIAGVAVNMANQLHSGSSDDEVIKAVRSMLQAGTIERARAEKILCKNIGITKGTLNDIVSKIKEDIMEDLGRVLATKTIETQYFKGKGLIHNGQFWAYNGKHWRPVTNESVGGKVLTTLDKIRDTVDIPVKDNTIKTEAVSLIASLVSTDDDLLNMRGKPKPIINCQNGEVWISEDGTPTLKPHKPSSNLLQVLNTDYIPGSECPRFDKAIRQTFKNFKDGEDMVRHFEEYMGYCLHPIKHKPLCWLFKGPGGDGKSTLISIVGAILGNESVLSTSIDKFRTGNGGDNHATASLVGKLLVYDDDLNANTTLPDGAIKTISSDGQLTANPKGKDTFTFTKMCTVTLLSNGFPKTKAVDRGFRRRATVIPFNNAFHEHDGVANLSTIIIENELAGVLNRALQGLKRLRKRGDFKLPLSCTLALNDWLDSANNVVTFVNNKLEITTDNTDRISSRDMYTAYCTFCHERGVGKVETQSEMVKTMQDLELNYCSIGSNKKGFRLVKFNSIEAMDDFDDLD